MMGSIDTRTSIGVMIGLSIRPKIGKNVKAPWHDMFHEGCGKGGLPMRGDERVEEQRGEGVKWITKEKNESCTS